MERDRSAERDYLADHWGSSRTSHEGSDLLDDDSDFLTGTSILTRDTSYTQNGAPGSAPEDVDADEGDEGLDDDMVDKISSSPSIDDGTSVHDLTAVATAMSMASCENKTA